jgi:hypothetical protein
VNRNVSEFGKRRKRQKDLKKNWRPETRMKGRDL